MTGKKVFANSNWAFAAYWSHKMELAQCKALENWKKETFVTSAHTFDTPQRFHKIAK